MFFNVMLAHDRLFLIHVLERMLGFLAIVSKFSLLKVLKYFFFAFDRNRLV